MPLSRRTLLQAAALAGVAPLARGLAACDSASAEPIAEYVYEGPRGADTLFSHGVASGDPLADAVVLWTRVTVDDGAAHSVFWEIARDVAFTDRVGAGEVQTDAARDHTVKIDVQGLNAGATYFYRFWLLGRVSPTGRTRTAPKGKTDHLRFGVASCASMLRGYFAGYRHMAARDDLAAIIHVGDYIYEYGTRPGEIRPHEPPLECFELNDYRTRYAQYRTDPDLAALHATHPFICVWDDHEIVNGAWRGGSSSHDANSALWEDRKAAAVQAWNEWIPARIDIPDRPDRIFRRLQFGDLVDLIMLDTRLIGRDHPVGSADFESLASTERSVLGAEQEAWLTRQLAESTTRWRVLGQQIMMGQFKTMPTGADTLVLNPDQWDGYWAAREALYADIRANGERNVVVLTGDFHANWAFDLVEDPNDPAQYDPDNGVHGVAVEFVVPSITNGGAEVVDAIVETLYDANPQLHWVSLGQRGYVVLDITRDRVQGAWYHLDDHEDPLSGEYFNRAYSVRHGVPHLVRDTDPA